MAESLSPPARSGLQTVRCAACPARFPVREAIGQGTHLCSGCLEARFAEAYRALYGHELCRTCDRVLVTEDEQQGGYCRQCDGVSEAWGDDDDDD